MRTFREEKNKKKETYGSNRLEKKCFGSSVPKSTQFATSNLIHVPAKNAMPARKKYCAYLSFKADPAQDFFLKNIR